MCPDTEPRTYFEKINETVEDFTISMQIQSHNFDIAKEAMIAQLRLLFAQGIITQEAFQTLCQPVTDMKHYFTATESNYYAMRNILEKHEKQDYKECE